MKRRLFVKNAIAGGIAITALNAGLLTSGNVIASTDDFATKSKNLMDLLGSATEGSFDFKAPNIAENGAVVPLEVDASNIDDVKSISVLVRKNATPLAASFNFLDGSVGYASVRIKMGETSPVVALVNAGGKDYAIEKEVKVTIGGCGG